MDDEDSRVLPEKDVSIDPVTPKSSEENKEIEEELS
jgi:hypothetical protein